MALSQELEEELTCPIDLELFVEPMSLKCRHILCKKDVDHMIDEDGLLKCPKCNKVSERRDIKHDFRTQRLLDLHTADKHRLKKQRLCDNCEDEVASSWCEECQAYLGERCERGHMKLKATCDHKLVKIRVIIEEHKSAITDVLEKLEKNAHSFQDLKDKAISQLTELDGVLEKGVDEMKLLEDRVIETIRKTFGKTRTELKTDINERKETVTSVIAEWQSCQNECEREVKLLKDCIQEDDCNALLDKEVVNDLIKSSNQKSDGLADKKAKTNTPAFTTKISVNNVERVVNAIEKISVSVSYQETGPTEIKEVDDVVSCDDTKAQEQNEQKSNHAVAFRNDEAKKIESEASTKEAKLNRMDHKRILEGHEQAKASNSATVEDSTNTKRPESVVSHTKTEPDDQRSDTKQAQHRQSAAGESGCATAEGNTLSLEQYTGHKIHVKPLCYDHKPSTKAKQVVSINDDIWIVMDDGTIRVFNLPDNGKLHQVLAFQTNKVYNTDKYQIYHIIQGPHGTIVAMAKIKGLFKSLLKGNIAMELDDKGNIIRAVSKTDFSHLVADQTYLYGVTGLRVQSLELYRLQESGWCHTKTVGLPGMCNSLVVHDNTITMTTLELFPRAEKQAILVKRFHVATNRETKVKHFQNDSNLLTGDQEGSVLLYSQNKLHVLFRDNRCTDIAVDISSDSMIRCATIEKEGRLIVLRSDGSLYTLIPQTC